MQIVSESSLLFPYYQQWLHFIRNNGLPFETGTKCPFGKVYDPTTVLIGNHVCLLSKVLDIIIFLSLLLAWVACKRELGEWSNFGSVRVCVVTLWWIIYHLVHHQNPLF